jgi:hypothetical protein
VDGRAVGDGSTLGTAGEGDGVWLEHAATTATSATDSVERIDRGRDRLTGYIVGTTANRTQPHGSTNRAIESNAASLRPDEWWKIAQHTK